MWSTESAEYAQVSVGVRSVVMWSCEAVQGGFVELR